MTKQSITAIALSLCLSGAMLTSCSESAEKTIATTKKIIKVFPIQKKTVTDTGEWIGYLRGVQDTDLYPRVSGFITEYKEGQYVEEGEVIYQIDSKPFEAELARSQANLAAAKAALQQAESSRDQLKQDVERYEQGAKSGAVSDKTLTDTKHNYAAAVAKVEACVADIKQQEAAVQRADINLKYASVKAPYTGFVGTSNVSTGDLVSQGTKLGNIISEGPLRVDFSINSDALLKSFERYGKVQSAHRDPELKDASPAFDILLEDGSVFEHKGRLLSMNSQIDSTGLIDIVGEVDNPDGKLRGGMKINVRIPLQTKETLLVPQNAIRTVMRNAFIIIVDKDNIPHTVPVTVGKEYEVDVEEANGYKSTQKLVSISDYKDTSLEEQFKKYGYGDFPSDWENGEPGHNNTLQRLSLRFSAPIYSLALCEYVRQHGIDVMFDTVVTDINATGGHIDSIIVFNKSGHMLYEADMFVDTTGDADILNMLGVPTVTQGNYHTYYAFGTT
ncbi:MAG: efflux RND transporter periplasmic adaptor subunit, partial [Akkermansia sp.]|nr:efflux RND transporter periplasmic adaptor subunit [Akkermansia sp.]